MLASPRVHLPIAVLWQVDLVKPDGRAYRREVVGTAMAMADSGTTAAVWWGPVLVGQYVGVRGVGIVADSQNIQVLRSAMKQLPDGVKLIDTMEA